MTVTYWAFIMCQKRLWVLLHTIKQPHTTAVSGPWTLHRKKGHVIWRWMKWLGWEPAIRKKSQLIANHIVFHFPYCRTHYGRVSLFALLNIHMAPMAASSALTLRFFGNRLFVFCQPSGRLMGLSAQRRILICLESLGNHLPLPAISLVQ